MLYAFDIFLLTYEELSVKTLDLLPGGLGERLRGLVAEAGEQGRQGVAWALERQVVVGRKAVEDGGKGEKQHEGVRGADAVTGKTGKNAGKSVVGKSKDRKGFLMRFFRRSGHGA